MAKPARSLAASSSSTETQPPVCSVSPRASGVCRRCFDRNLLIVTRSRLIGISCSWAFEGRSNRGRMCRHGFFRVFAGIHSEKKRFCLRADCNSRRTGRAPGPGVGAITWTNAPLVFAEIQGENGRVAPRMAAPSSEHGGGYRIDAVSLLSIGSLLWSGFPPGRCLLSCWY